jgi:site-specific DNA-methyltransferase (adenine-specific)
MHAEQQDGAAPGVAGMNPVIIGDATLYLGDCLEILPTLAAVDSVISDPPFEAEAHTLQRRVKRGPHSAGVDDRQAMNTPLSFEPLSFEPLSFELRQASGAHIARLARRWALVFCQCEASQLWRSALEPMKYRRTAVWIKPDGMPQYSGDRPGMGYESLVCCHAEGRSRWNGGGRTGVFTHNKNSGGKHEHETQKPVPLMRELVALFSDPAETILDPFMGSGTTGVACAQLGRKFIGIEIEPKYFDIARKRIEAAYAQGRLFEPEPPAPEQGKLVA